MWTERLAVAGLHQLKSLHQVARPRSFPVDKLPPPTYYSLIMASDRIQRRIERLLDQIEQAMDSLEWATVRDRAQAALALDANNSDALTFLVAADQVLGASSTQPPSLRLTPQTPVAAPDDSTSFANGRYQVKRFLGDGGKKRLCLTHDTLLDREVAFALIKTEVLDDTSSIQREAQARGRLGSRPH